ncbi:class I SAM-dependent methyltransferase [Streptomyces sp. NPDC049577]|uniref:class I SAM-dependent methyltransferase n=1 Tax=Streptomyces sp. NPDC049577 TaxID=3155153 RepID=UPI0034242E05
MSVSDRYLHAWEGFWEATSDEPGDAIWDSDPSGTAEPHLELFAPHADPALPVVDLGCGNGTRTRHLATHFRRAIGVDLSRAAVERARRADRTASAEFERLNLVDTPAVRALHERLGDCNVYMRAVIHQSDPSDRARVAAAVAELTGTRGRAFVVELVTAAREVLRRATEAPGGPPAKLRRVYDHDLRPAIAEDGEVARLLIAAGLETVAGGHTDLIMTEPGPDGTPIALPAQWFVLRRADGPVRGLG